MCLSSMVVHLTKKLSKVWVMLSFKSSSVCLFHCSSTPVSALCALVCPLWCTWFIWRQARFEWYYLLNRHHYTCFAADLLQSLVCACVLYGGSFDEEAQQGLSNAMYKSTYIICLFHCSSTPVFGVCVCVCVCVLYGGSLDKEVRQGLCSAII